MAANVTLTLDELALVLEALDHQIEATMDAQEEDALIAWSRLFEKFEQKKEVTPAIAELADTNKTDTFPKVCPCCNKSHDKASWYELQSLGFQPFYNDDGSESQKFALDMRNCECKSTITMLVRR